MKQVVLISGGSGCLGSATAEKLASKFNVIILGRHEDTLKKVANKLGCNYFVCDISNEQDVKTVVAKIIDQYKQIDYLINNAGSYIHGDVEECQGPFSSDTFVNAKRLVAQTV